MHCACGEKQLAVGSVLLMLIQCTTAAKACMTSALLSSSVKSVHCVGAVQQLAAGSVLLSADASCRAAQLQMPALSSSFISQSGLHISHVLCSSF